MLRGISKSRTVGLLSELAFASISNGDLRFLTIRRTLPIPENDFVLRVLKNALNIRQFDFRHVDSTLTETGRVDSIESCRIANFSEHPQSTDALYKSRANGLPVFRIDITGNESCRFDRIVSKRQHFQPTLYSPVALYFLSLAQIDFRHVESTLTHRVDSIQEITNRLPVMRIANARDESTLIGCIGQPS